MRRELERSPLLPRPEICAGDLEGIVAKRKLGIYKDDGNSWLKASDGSKRNTLSAIKAATGPSSGNPTMRRGHRRRCDCYLPLVHPSQDTLRSEAKPTRMIPRMKPTSQIAKGPICEIHFGVRKFFAFSGMTKTDVVPYAVRKSHASPAGPALSRPPGDGRLERGCEPRSSSPRVPRQGSSPPSFRL